MSTQTSKRTRVSKPTPTPSIDASMRKAKGAEGSLAMSAVLTKPQLLSAAYSRLLVPLVG